MADLFFTPWPLWAKMTFVLALAILFVFGIAYGKLVWKNRLIKKQEGRDEERRIAIEEARQGSRFLNSRKSLDIPFGVRAIQSGIQIDGIWISEDSAPSPANIKLGHMRNSLSDQSRSQSPNSRASQDSSHAAVPSVSSRGRTTHRESESRMALADERGTSSEGQDMRAFRPSYKPRRSSHLRYDSNGGVCHHENTLDQLESKEREEIHERLASTRGLEKNISSMVAADIKRSPGSTTDATLSSDTKLRTHVKRHSLHAPSSGEMDVLGITKIISGTRPRSALPVQGPMAECHALPLQPSAHAEMNTFTPSLTDSIDSKLAFKPPYARTARELAESGESQVPLLAHSRSASLFIPGELHMNKSARRVNSGFEVLPAGTFCVPAEFKNRGVAEDDEEVGEKGRLNKLQKKMRDSTSSQKPSDAFDSL